MPVNRSSGVRIRDEGKDVIQHPFIPAAFVGRIVHVQLLSVLHGLGQQCLGPGDGLGVLVLCVHCIAVPIVHLLVHFHLLLKHGAVGRGLAAFRRSRCREFAGLMHHFQELATAQFELDVRVVFQKLGIVGISILECFIEIAIQNGRSDFCSQYLVHDHIHSQKEKKKKKTEVTYSAG